jgi:hypothetical protein
VTKRYIESFGSGFEGGIEAFGNKLLFMQSDGGLCTWDNFSGLRAILSGPAGGVVGYSKTCYDGERGSPLIAVDMGGTSTDVSRYAGKLEHVFETTTAEGEFEIQILTVDSWLTHCISHHPSATTGYQHGSCWGRKSAVLPTWHVCRWSRGQFVPSCRQKYADIRSSLPQLIPDQLVTEKEDLSL